MIVLGWDGATWRLCERTKPHVCVCVCACPGGHGEKKQAIFSDSLHLPARAHFPHGPGVKWLQAVHQALVLSLYLSSPPPRVSFERINPP